MKCAWIVALRFDRHKGGFIALTGVDLQGGFVAINQRCDDASIAGFPRVVHHHDILWLPEIWSSLKLLHSQDSITSLKGHKRRRVIHFNVTEHPTSPWIVQQLSEAFPGSCPYHYLILDRNAKFGTAAIDLLAAGGIKPTRTSPASPWQNGIAERWIGSCRRELLDHVIVLNDIHLRRLIREYISYYHMDRIHGSLEKDSPTM